VPIPQSDASPVNHPVVDQANTLPVYLQDADTLVKSLPENYAALRQQIAGQTGDPRPLTMRSNQEGTTVFFPESMPSDSKGQLSIGLCLRLAKLAGMKIQLTKKESLSFWDTLDGVQSFLKGAFYCLNRDQITGTDNIPRLIQRGWDYSLWYAFSKACKENEHADWMSVKRVTSIVDPKSGSWGAAGTGVELLNISAFVRVCAQLCAHKIGNIKKFIKGEGYFLEKYVGRKPVAGLYTPSELERLQHEWSDRQRRVREAYRGIPDRFNAEHAALGTLGTIIAALNPNKDDMTKFIEDAKSKRIPYLLITTGNKNRRISRIVTGSSLDQKLISLGGGDSVRTIGKVMHSPLYIGVSSNMFVDVCIKQARSIYLKNDTSYLQTLAANPDLVGANITARILAYQADISVVSTVYLECFQEHRGNETWEASLAH